MRKFLFFICLLTLNNVYGQDKAVNPRPLTIDEYDKAKKFSVADLDKDTYVKLDNSYILDRYESRKPYFITGDDGLKKRIDLYKFLSKEGMQELGVMVYYTNESGKRFQALVPNFTADGKVWERYFQDVDDINKVEKNFILKVSYILSKEFSFQQYKVLNGDKNLSEEAATYGSDICFPGSEEVAMADGSKKLLKDVQKGDEVLTVDPFTQQTKSVKVQELTTHEAKNYAITSLTLISSQLIKSNDGIEVRLRSKKLEATPNHPIRTQKDTIRIGDIVTGDKIWCLNEQTGKYEAYTVFEKTEAAKGKQEVYNIVAAAGDTFVMSGVVVMQK